MHTFVASATVWPEVLHQVRPTLTRNKQATMMASMIWSAQKV